MQQVNLYLPEFRPRREPILALHMAVIVGGFIVLLSLITGIGMWQNHSAAERVAAIKAQLDGFEAQVQELRAKQPKSKKAQWDKKIERLEEEVARRERIEKLIADQNLGNSVGFSQQLEAMARQHRDSLSIERFGLMEGGNYVELSGWARQADQVPLYIQRLREEESFEKVGFGVLTIEKSEQRRDAMLFGLARPKGDAS